MKNKPKPIYTTPHLIRGGNFFTSHSGSIEVCVEALRMAGLSGDPLRAARQIVIEVYDKNPGSPHAFEFEANIYEGILGTRLGYNVKGEGNSTYDTSAINALSRALEGNGSSSQMWALVYIIY